MPVSHGHGPGTRGAGHIKGVLKRHKQTSCSHPPSRRNSYTSRPGPDPAATRQHVAVNDFSHRCWPSLSSQGRQLADSQNFRSPDRRGELSGPCHGQVSGSQPRTPTPALGHPAKETRQAQDCLRLVTVAGCPALFGDTVPKPMG